ncbi:MAG: hypothetical protein SWH61_03265 [Thermodesulfobacteriota bacterium]|nr:hypothetical protein [Thermodesulfobacteriota bacterium]
MADKGIRVADDAGGESVACVDARNNDDGGNPRLLQLAANVTSPATPQSIASGTPIRTISLSDDYGDGLNLHGDYIVAAVRGAVLDVSDADSFVVYATVEQYDTGEVIYPMLTPIIFNEASPREVCALLHPTLLRPVSWVEAQPDEMEYVVHYYDGETRYIYPTVAEIYPSCGAKYIGFHVQTYDLNTAVIRIYAYKLTGSLPFTGVPQAFHTEGIGNQFSGFPGGAGGGK